MVLQKIDNLLESAESHNVSSPWWFIARELNKSLIIHMKTLYLLLLLHILTFHIGIVYHLFVVCREGGRRQQDYSSVLDQCLSSIITGSWQCCRKKSSTHFHLLFPGLHCPLLAAMSSIHAATLCARREWPTLKLIHQKAKDGFHREQFCIMTAWRLVLAVQELEWGSSPPYGCCDTGELLHPKHRRQRWVQRHWAIFYDGSL